MEGKTPLRHRLEGLGGSACWRGQSDVGGLLRKDLHVEGVAWSMQLPRENASSGILISSWCW